MKNTESLRLLTVDDHTLILLGLEHLIQKCIPEITEIDSASSGRDALALLAEKKYDIYILDFELSDMTCLELVKHIRTKKPDARIIINTMHEELWYVRKLKEIDVDGIVYKSVGANQLIEAMRYVMEGKTYYCDKLTKAERAYKLTQTHEGEDLTDRELSVLKCISEGKSTADIAEELFISVNTVETHRRHITEKLGAKNVATLIMKAVSKGLLPIPK